MTFHLNLEQLRKQAKDRVRERRAAGEEIKLSDIQFELAREHGFASWPKLCSHLNGARAAVLAYLARPAIASRNETPGDSRPRAGIFNALDGPRFTTDLDTVAFLKERHVAGRHLFVLGFEADDLHPAIGRAYLEGLFHAELLPAGDWRAYGTADRARRPQRRVNLGFSAGPRFFIASGTVDAGDADIARVRLRSSNGVTLEDDTTAGWLVLCTETEIDGPFELDLIDSAGAVIATEPWGDPEYWERVRARRSV